MKFIESAIHRATLALGGRPSRWKEAQQAGGLRKCIIGLLPSLISILEHCGHVVNERRYHTPFTLFGCQPIFASSRQHDIAVAPGPCTPLEL